MLLDLIDLSKLRRAIVYALLLMAVLIVQNLALSRLTGWGVRALIIPAMVVGVGLFEDGLWGGMVGLAAGYFSDLAYADHVVLFTILLPTAGFFAGALGKYMLHKGFMSYMTLALVVLSVVAFCQMFSFLFFAGEDARAFQALYLGGTASRRIWRTGLIQTAWSLVWAIPLYFPCKLIAGRPMGR